MAIKSNFMDINMRIGFGYDIHKFKKGNFLILGGISIPYKLGLYGHSDADVVTHSICDAILGAANLGDIGDKFPNNVKFYRKLCSLNLLEQSYKIIIRNNFKLVNIDTIIFAQKPIISPYKKRIAKNIAKKIEINTNQINIKAKTTEELGIIGGCNGIASMSIALIT